jgi:(S)-ureidoglycine aminohydrolase
MKQILIILFFYIPFFAIAQKDTIPSGVFSWKESTVKTKKKLTRNIMYEGMAHDFEWMQMTANSLQTTKKMKLRVSEELEELIIIKSGTLKIKLNDTIHEISNGSIALLMPGQNYSIQNSGSSNCKFYSMKYKSKSPMNLQRGLANGGSFVKNWNDIAYKPNNNGGGRRDFLEKPTAMQRRLEIHVTTLRSGIKSHEPHTHKAEEIVLMLENKTEMQIGQSIVKALVGDIYFLGSNVLHAIKNIDTQSTTYFAIQFE